jgi:general secretion pathway protein C
MRQFPLDRENLAQTAVVTLATAAALILLGFVGAYWTWTWFAPAPAASAPAAAVPAGRISAGALFGSVQRDPVSAAPTGIAIRLLGIVAAQGGLPGYAVVELEPRQILAVREGDDVAPGIRLAEVGPDQIILERGGIRETLAWPDKTNPPEPVPRQTN